MVTECSKSQAARRAVILDRDGVLNQATVVDGKPYAPRTLDDFKLVAGVHESISLLRNAGFLLVVATNQPDVGAGIASREAVEAMNERLVREGLCDAVYVCFHTDADRCACRKPRAGMLLNAALDYGIDLEASYAIGDRWRDVSAAKSVGCLSIFIDFGYVEALDPSPDVTVANLREAVDYILTIESRRMTKGLS